jgi:hypothetical protein
MNNMRLPTNLREPSASFLKTPLFLAVALALASIFWSASLPLARAAAVTPAELIQVHLPHAMNLGNAPKADLLSAVCKAITRNQKEAPAIARTAAGARRELAPDILKTAVHCIRDENCELCQATLRELIAADSSQAAALTELFARLMPDCPDSPEEGPGGAASANNIGAAPGSVGGGAATSGDICLVCHNNQSIQVPCSGLNSYLRGHPGDTAGACEATPVSNP